MGVFSEDSDGKPKKLIMQGNSESFTASWINKRHQTLGSFLHAPTLSKLKQKGPTSNEIIAEKLATIIADVTKVVSSTFRNFRMQKCIREKCCAGCGATIVRDIKSVSNGEEILCPNHRCKAIHVIGITSEEWGLDLKTVTWACSECKKEITFQYPTHPQELWDCPECKTKWVVELRYHIARHDKIDAENH